MVRLERRLSRRHRIERHLLIVWRGEFGRLPISGRIDTDVHGKVISEVLT